MKNSLCFGLVAVAIMLLSSSCSKKLVPTSLNKPSAYPSFSEVNKEVMGNLNKTVENVVNAGGNLNRSKAILKRANSFGLIGNTLKENIDWFSLQKNILIELKGKTDSIVYVVSHYDKVDATPLHLPNIFLNGLLDPLFSWAYASDGAIDNATGVALSLQLAKELSKKDMKYTYRILLVGAEESGLRGSRAHVARLSIETVSKIKYVINTDVVGVKNKKNCVTTNVSNGELTELALRTAKELNLEFGEGKMPSGASSDFASFKKNSFATNFGRSLRVNLPGAFLPQRSYFTKKKEAEVINFSSCKLLDAGDYTGGMILIPVGSIHGFRDTIKRVDEKKLLEQFLIIKTLAEKMELEPLKGLTSSN